MDWMQILERYGLPTLFCIWLMRTFTKELREMRRDLNKLTITVAVVAKTLDVDAPLPSLPPPLSKEDAE